MIREEVMSGEFGKFHLSGPWPFAPAIHRFTGPDRDGPHDHPWSFTTHILHGGYIEEVFHIEGGTWSSEIIHRKPGTAHFIRSDHIHRIIELPQGECWTLVIAGETERVTRFWDFGEKIRYRAWHDREFTDYTGDHP